MDSLGNVNHAISIVGSWIFDSNYEKALVLNRASLDMICASSIGEEQAECFEKVYYSVRFISKEAQLKKKKSTTERRIFLISLFEKKRCQITLISPQKRQSELEMI